MPNYKKTLAELDDYLEEMYDSLHDSLLLSTTEGSYATSEQIITFVAKMKFIDEIQAFYQEEEE